MSLWNLHKHQNILEKTAKALSGRDVWPRSAAKKVHPPCVKSLLYSEQLRRPLIPVQNSRSPSSGSLFNTGHYKLYVVFYTTMNEITQHGRRVHLHCCL